MEARWAFGICRCCSLRSRCRRQRLVADPDALYALVEGVAAGRASKADVAVFLRERSVPRGSQLLASGLHRPLPTALTS
jgi:hypothetical protein